MLNLPAQVSAASFAAPASSTARAVAPSFSYDEAVAALERQSAQALEVHGGRPNTAVSGGRAAVGTTEQGPSRAATPQNDPHDSSSAEAGHAAIAQQAARAPKSAPPASPLAAPVGAPVAPPAAVTPSTVLQPTAPGATSPREGAARNGSEAPRAPIPVRTPPGAVKQFAEILAQRLDGASQFDLRLDPPALGSVEGRLILADDGGARLALSFDNQSAFDLFRRDEAALRLALADAGFDLAGRNLQFSFRPPTRAEATVAEPSPAPSFAAPAPFHHGAIDIRA